MSYYDLVFLGAPDDDGDERFEAFAEMVKIELENYGVNPNDFERFHEDWYLRGESVNYDDVMEHIVEKYTDWNGSEYVITPEGYDNVKGKALHELKNQLTLL